MVSLLALTSHGVDSLRCSIHAIAVNSTGQQILLPDKAFLAAAGVVGTAGGVRQRVRDSGAIDEADRGLCLRCGPVGLRLALAVVFLRCGSFRVLEGSAEDNAHALLAAPLIVGLARTGSAVG